MKSKTNFDKYTLAGFGAIALWSISLSLVRSISEQIGPFTTIAAVYLTGGTLLLGKEFLLKERTFRNLRLSPPKHFVGCGLLLMVYSVSLYVGLGLAKNRIQTLEIGLVNFLWTTFTILFSLFFLKTKVRWTLIPATILALIGISFVITQGTEVSLPSFKENILGNPVAYGLGLSAALSWGLYSNLTRVWSGTKNENSVPFFIIITGIVLLIISRFTTESSAFNIRVVVEVTVLGISTALSYVFWDVSMRKGKATLVASCAYLTPLLSTIVGCLYLQVAPGNRLWIGCVMIIIGSYFSWRSVSE